MAHGPEADEGMGTGGGAPLKTFNHGLAHLALRESCTSLCLGDPPPHTHHHPTVRSWIRHRGLTNSNEDNHIGGTGSGDGRSIFHNSNNTGAL